MEVEEVELEGDRGLKKPVNWRRKQLK